MGNITIIRKLDTKLIRFLCNIAYFKAWNDIDHSKESFNKSAVNYRLQKEFGLTSEESSMLVSLLENL